MSRYMKVWQCVDCGRIESIRGCTHKCRDHQVALIDAEVHEQVCRELEAARAEIARLATCMRQIIGAEPRNEQWERCFRFAQEHLRRSLALVGR